MNGGPGDQLTFTDIVLPQYDTVTPWRSNGLVTSISNQNLLTQYHISYSKSLLKNNSEGEYLEEEQIKIETKYENNLKIPPINREEEVENKDHKNIMLTCNQCDKLF